jgi:4-amino-4-deoxy-L-arabinose transferase-like glycosyltransferase
MNYRPVPLQPEPSPIKPRGRWPLSALWLGLIIGIALWWNLGSTGLLDETEPLFAEAARQMWKTGDWITPYFNGNTRFDKPPLIYWLMAAAYQVIGANEWAVRLPSALAATGLAVFVFLTLRRFGFSRPAQHGFFQPTPKAPADPQTDRRSLAKTLVAAWIGAALTVLNLQTMAWGRIGVSDMLLSGCMGAGLLAYFWGYALAAQPNREPDGSGQAGSDSLKQSNPERLASKRSQPELFQSEPFQPKPFQSEPFQSEPFQSEPSQPKQAQFKPAARTQADRWYLATAIFLALAVLAKGPVGVVIPIGIVVIFLFYTGNLRSGLAELRLGRLILVFLAITLPWYVLVIGANGEAYIESFFGYHNVERFTRVVNSHWAPIWFYLVVVPIGFLPWSAYLPVAITRLRFWQIQRWRQQPRASHLSLFALIWFGVILGFFTIAATKLPSYTLPLLPAAAILVALFWSDQLDKPLHLSSVRPVNRAVWLTHLANIGLALILAVAVFLSPNWLGNEPEMPELAELVQQSGIALWGSAIWLTIALIELGLLLGQRSQWIWTVQLLGWVAFVLMTLLPAAEIVDAQRQLPLRQIAAEIVQQQQPNEPVLMVGRKPSLVFYTQRSITFVPAPGDVAAQLDKFSRRLSRPRSRVRSLLLVGRPNKLREAGIQESDYEMLASAGVYRLGRMNFSDSNPNRPAERPAPSTPGSPGDSGSDQQSLLQ